MADAWVTFGKIHTPGKPTGGGPIRQDEFLAEFKVRVAAPGCYAIVPTLRSYSRLPSLPFFDTDTDVGYVGGAQIDCYCFRGQEEKTFYVTGQGARPDDAKPLKPDNPQATKLKSLEGHWPKSDFPFDNLELYVTVKVVLCKSGECTTDTDCGAFDTNDDDDQKIVGEAKSTRQRDAKIKGGKSSKEILEDALKKAAEEAVGKALPPK
jgi:hypothetical protein